MRGDLEETQKELKRVQVGRASCHLARQGSALLLPTSLLQGRSYLHSLTCHVANPCGPPPADLVACWSVAQRWWYINSLWR